MGKFNPFGFVREVRTETAKVTWPSRRETMVTTLLVFVMVLIAAMFFLLADQAMSFIIGYILDWSG